MVDDDPERLLTRFQEHRPPPVAKWIDRGQT
jgi:hypothetical protein